MKKSPIPTAAANAYINSSDAFFFFCNNSRGRVSNADGDSSDEILEHGNVFWFILSIFIIAGNLTVIIWRCRAARREKQNSIPSILVINLAAADFFLGIQVFLYVLLYSNWLCFAWTSPNDKTLMTALCSISGFFETACIYASGMISATIAVYYAVVVFGRCCCVRRFSRSCLLALLCIAWIVSVAVAISTVSIVLSYSLNIEKNVNKIISLYSNSSRMIDTGFCLPVTHTVSVFFRSGSLLWHHENAHEAVIKVGGILFSVMCCLIVATAGTYLAILLKLLRRRASSTSPLSLSASVGSLGFRLAAIAVITLLGWTCYVILLFVCPQLVLGQTLPYGFVALSNPITFTLLSERFLRPFRKCKEKVLFKMGRPLKIEELASESGSLIATRVPSTTQEYS